jgi:hypothetical protein
MAENKKSFLLYCDQIGLFRQLPDELAGKLIKHIFSYVNDENPETDDLLINIAFEPIKTQLKRDLKEWEKSLETKSESGKLGNLKRWHLDLYTQVIENKISIDEALNIATSRKTSHTDEVQSQNIANIAVNVNVNDNVTDNVKDIKVNTSYQLCVDFWLKEFHPDFTFNATAGNKLKSIIKKFETLLKNNGKEITENTIFESFKIMCQKLPEWYKNKDLSVIDSKFNEIIQEIKNGTNSKQEQRKDAAAEAIRLLTGAELR